MSRARDERTAMIDSVLENTRPLTHARGDRLPFYAWSLTGLPSGDDKDTERTIADLDDRGIAVIAAWDHNRRKQSLGEVFRIAGMQRQRGLSVNINANALLHSFCNGDPSTAHLAENGERFFDTSFSPGVKMGCPFALRSRYPDIRERVEWFVNQHRENDVPVDFVFADWEIDGAMEWNDAWSASKNCTRCRENIPEIDDFASFQKVIREVRADMQRDTYADPIRRHFPDALVGNYGAYPNDGYRYWYDYFEQPGEGVPCKHDQRARYRRWFQEFPLTGYTVAMPVVYTWYNTFDWYDFTNPDYRWFYNMLLVASNAGSSAGTSVPLVTFVHWHTTSPPSNPDPDTIQFSERMYQELLWHMLLRGHDTFFVWCPPEETAKEVRLAHEVYAASMQYRDFLDRGLPVTYSVSTREGPIVSGLRLGHKVLVRRTDFTDSQAICQLSANGRTVPVPRMEGKCLVLDLP